MIVEIICILAAAGAATAVVIYWDDIVNSLCAHKLKQDDVAVLIREKLANGKQVRVSASIFQSTPYASPHYQQTWVGDAVDEVLNDLFREQDDVEIKL